MSKPQDLPAGNAQMKIGIVLAFVTYVMALSIPFGIIKAVLQAALDLLGTAILLWIALQQTGKIARFEQAFGGLCGASAFINLAGLPIYALGIPVEASSEASGGIAQFVLLVWGLSLLAHIIRHTFEVKMFSSVFIAFVYVLFWSSVITLLVPPNSVSQQEVTLPSAVLAQIDDRFSTTFGVRDTFELVAVRGTVL